MVIEDASPEISYRSTRTRSEYSFWSMTHAIEQRETGEPLIVLTESKKGRVMLDPFWKTADDLEGECYQSYIAKHPDFTLSVRRGVKDRLDIVRQQLPDYVTLVVKAGFRPYEVQVAVLEAFIAESERVNPNWTAAQHLSQARTYVADPRIVCPPHTTGGAIDVDLIDSHTGLPIDMGCPPNTDSDIAFLHSDLLSAEQYANRMILLDAMLAAGFAPNPYEWWHYQYGETYWAAFYGHSETLYDSIPT
jgi:D-alanyl-D-alanine dipeptidase